MADSDLDETLAIEYRESVHAASTAGIEADPEAQLTNPVSRLLTRLMAVEGIGTAHFIRETHENDVKPDFGVLVDARFRGWLELKAPHKGVDPTKWSAPHDIKQWGELQKLDNLILCDGRKLQHFSEGEAQGSAVSLPFDSNEWNSDELTTVMRQFAAQKPLPIRSASQLAKALAPLAKDLRLRIEEGLSTGSVVAPIEKAKQIWADLLQDSVQEDRFADALAQVITYSLVIATLDGEGDLNDDGQVDIAEAQKSLDTSHRVLAATLRPVLEVEGLMEALRGEIGALERLLGAVNTEAVEKRKDPRGDTWLWFYEDFLEAYDPEARKKAGVYYTPVPVVDCIVRLVEQVLTDRFGLRLGFGDEQVVALDPAVGTGTFPLSVIDHAAIRAEEERGEAGPSQIAQGLVSRLFGFEILPGPFAVSHLRVGERLSELGASLDEGGAQILLADTLDSPIDDPDSKPLALFGPAQVLSEERQRAKEIKRNQPVMVILGNPPYARLKRENGGGWVVHGDSDTEPALFDDVLATANERTSFAHVASLYNLYAYFWRWSIWKAFEQQGDGPGVVAMITGSSWLAAPGFVGLRELARDLCDEIWIVDLGGDNKGTSPEDNVFAIETPVAIAILIRDGAGDASSPAEVRYRRIKGSKKEKLKAVEDVQQPDPKSGDWLEIESQRWATFLPPSGDEEWEGMPALFDLMPWQQPGCKLNRTWPVAPDRDTLVRRWREFLEDPSVDRRSELFPDRDTGRKVTTQVGDMSKLSELPQGADSEALVPYSWRAFDRQWTFEDPRLAKTESPSLWQSRSGSQIFLATLGSDPIGKGPALIPFVDTPDLHAFNNRGGKDILPLYRDAEAKQPNITEGLLDRLGDRLGCSESPSPEDLAAYLFALLSTPGYQMRFAEQLEAGPPRVPLTADLALWNRATEIGGRLLWLQTFAERFQSPERDQGDRIPDVPGLSWRTPVTGIPKNKDAIEFMEEDNELRVGDGVVVGVRPKVWGLQISGWPVVKRWLEHRTASGRGKKKSSELDQIRPEKWRDSWNDELLDLLRVLTLSIEEHEAQAQLLEAVLEGPVIPASDLPLPSEAERKVPKTIKNNSEPSALTFDDLESK